MQGGDPAFLAIGTQVSAKYKGAYCEAKVKSVDKQIKVRVTLKGPHGNNGSSLAIRDKDIISINNDGPLVTGAIVKIKHPDTSETLEGATVKQIQDQSRYTVIFNDGDIATLKRNALCMKSGKHFNASESLDNLPLTHPEHFSSPASVLGSGSRGSSKKSRHKTSGLLLPTSNVDDDVDDDDEDSDSSDEGGDDDLVNDPYTSNIGRVVWAENTDKKTKAKDSWFLALIVSPSASDTAKIRTKKEFLIRSFKDGRFYTVSKKDTQKFRHNESPVKKTENPSLKEAMERAIAFLETRELPPHWDRDILLHHEEESTNNSTTASSESEELEDDDEEDESPEEKDHLVAELYKHMEDRGSPIDKTPSIEGKDVDLYKLYRIVDKLGGNVRVTNKNMWRTVANKLGFISTWGINQVRVHYNRYLRSFEDLNRTLGCTMVNHPKTSSTTALGSVARHRQISGSSRVQMRGTSRAKASSSLEEKALNVLDPKDAEAMEEPNLEETKEEKVVESPQNPPPPPAAAGSNGNKRAKKGKRLEEQFKKKEEMKMTTRPRRDSTSSLAAAMQVKEKKDSMVSSNNKESKETKESPSSKKPVVRMDRNKETENEAKKLQVANSSSPSQSSKSSSLISLPSSTSSSSSSSSSTSKAEAIPVVEKEKPSEENMEEKKKRSQKNLTSSSSSSSLPPSSSLSSTTSNVRKKDDKEEEEEFQHLAEDVEVAVGDRIRVFYKFDVIYEAKVKRVQNRESSKYPRYFVHYQGWNARYDEWIKRSKIKENLSWSRDRVKGEENPDNQDKDSSESETNVQEKKKPGPKRTAAATASTPLKKELKRDTSRAGTPSSVTSKGSRTGSPALKRQSSRTSTKKETDSDDENEDSEPSNGSSSRKSSRLVKSPMTASEGSLSKKSSRKRLIKEQESENEDVEIMPEKDDIKPLEAVSVTEEQPPPVKSKRGRKKNIVEDSGSEVESGSSVKTDTRSSSRATPTREKQKSQPPSTRKTPSSTTSTRNRRNQPPQQQQQQQNEAEAEQEVDPYAFKEPENIKEKKAKSEERSASEDKKIKVESASDSTDSSSSDIETKIKSPSSTRSSSRTLRRSAATATTTASSEEEEMKNIHEEVKEEKKVETLPEIEACEKEKPDENVQKQTSSTSPTSSGLGLTKKQQEIFPNLASKISKIVPEEPIEVVHQEPKKEPLEISEQPNESISLSSTRKQRKTPSKPKSDELVDSETESDSSNENESNIKKVQPQPPSQQIAKKSKRKLEDADMEDEPLIKAKTASSTTSRKPTSSSPPSPLASKAKVPDEDDLDLVCAETIPGSPNSAPVASVASVVASNVSEKAEDNNRLEMPFASVPESVQGPINPSSATSTLPATLPPTAETPDTTASSATPTPSSRLSPAALTSNVNNDNNDECKSPGGDSSEVDMESLKAESVDIEGSSSGEAKRGTKRKAPSSDVGSRSPAPSRRKRRAREAASGSGMRGGRGGRGRHASERHHNDDSDESEEASGKDATLSEIGSLDNDALAALAQRSPRSSKYNFYPDFDSSMDSNTRIALIQQNIKNLKKAYQSIKSKLATTERQIKKIRRKEREKSEDSKSTAIEASA